MPKREMRIVKYIGTGPYLAVCTSCNQQFTVADTVMRTVEDARANLQEQFDGHECKPLDASQNAVRIVREATENI